MYVIQPFLRTKCAYEDKKAEFLFSVVSTFKHMDIIITKPLKRGIDS